MIAQNHKAFTLIELLIVVVMIAIMTAGMIAYIVVPPREQLRATTDMEHEAGLTMFFSKLVADAHNATGLAFDRNKKTLILEESAGDASAVYWIDQKDCLRRCTMTRQQAENPIQASDEFNPAIPSNMLVGNVTRFEIVPLENGKMWRIDIGIATGDRIRPMLERGIELRIANTGDQANRSR